MLRFEDNHNSLNQGSDASLICLAEITSPHGIKGAVKLKTFTTQSLDLKSYKNLKDNTGQFYKIHILSVPSSSSLVVSLQGVSDRTQAEKLRGVKLYVERSDLPRLAEEEFYYADLIGMTVVNDQGQKIGLLQSVQDYGAGAFLEIKTDSNAVYSIAFTKQAVPEIDLKSKQIKIDPAFLLNNN